MEARRKCVKCGAGLTDEDVMKIKREDGSWEIIPLPICPDCFTEQMRKRIASREKNLEKRENTVE